MSEICEYKDTLVGVIRWDGWLGDTRTFKSQKPPYIGNMTEYNLSFSNTQLNAKGYHDRVPFYGKEINEDTILARQSSPEIPLQRQQEIMDMEISYARRAGIDYWAFCWSGSNDGMDEPRILFENSCSPDKSGLNYCAIIGNLEQVFDSGYGAISHFVRNDYQKVFGDRPLLFIVHCLPVTPEEIQKIRDVSFPFNPYIVTMGNIVKGADALSYYATSSGAHDIDPYSELVRNEESIWETDKNKSQQMKPIVTTGWDVRPRIEGYGFNFYNAQSKWTLPSTANELKQHFQAAFVYVKANRACCSANSILIYFWNGFDESGNCLCPSLYYGANILDILAEVQRIQIPITEALTEGKYSSKDYRIIYGGAPDIINNWQCNFSRDRMHQSNTAGEYIKFAYTGSCAKVYGYVARKI